MKKIIWILIVTTIFLESFSFAQNQKVWQKFSIPEKINLTSFLSKIDYSALPDDDIQKFVGVNKPFHNLSYEPSDLVPLQWRSHISAQARHTLRKEAAENLEKMANAFYAKFWKNIVIASAYRSYSYQKNSISESCKKSGRCAREWESEHQLWLAVDLWEATNDQKFLSKYQKYYDRLHENAHLYWFHQSYQNWREFDWYYIEPRHRRYLWVDLATKLHEKDITFTQYVNLNNSRNK
jgi:LAS superfamily LD-carboxypeptidase LdcB